MTTQTLNISASVVKVLVRYQCGQCRGYIGKPSGKPTVVCVHCNAQNAVIK